MNLGFNEAVAHLLFETDKLAKKLTESSVAQCQQDLAQAVYMCLSDDITLKDYIDFTTKKHKEYRK